jgi:hypothetical protein
MPYGANAQEVTVGRYSSNLLGNNDIAAVFGDSSSASSGCQRNHRCTRQFRFVFGNGLTSTAATGGNYLVDILPCSPVKTDPVPEVAQASYTFENLLMSVQTTTGYAEGSFQLANTAFGDGNIPLGVADDLAGLNNLTLGVQSDLLVNGYAALIGDGSNAGFVLEAFKVPPDLATALSEAQTFSADAQTYFSDALAAFGSGNMPTGLFDLAESNINAFGCTPDMVVLGVTEALFGSIPVD